jgi:Lipase (class 3)
MPTDQEMLTLAAIAYRGINLVLPEALKRAHLRRAMDACMATFTAVKDKWTIVWGPASFSVVSPGLDDALMYVAQSADLQNLAIAIRGTNPISLTDWVFGDLMVTHQVSWAYGDTTDIKDAKISASSALGLGILQRLRWDDAVLGATLSAPRPASLDGWLHAVQARLQSSTAASALQKFASNLGSAQPENFDPAALLQELPASQPASGADLKGFLRGHVEKYPNAEIYVTGHSKGGALSPTLALWLADTRGPQADKAEEWDPNKKTAVYAYAFAGPTAGNQEFAKHSDGVLTGCHRIWNKMDVVPYAFVVDDLQRFKAVYNLNPAERAVQDGLINRLIAEVASLNYTQICGAGTPFSGALIPNLPFALQLVHQHMDSYLINFDLINEMNAASLILAPVL